MGTLAVRTQLGWGQWRRILPVRMPCLRPLRLLRLSLLLRDQLALRQRMVNPNPKGFLERAAHFWRVCRSRGHSRHHLRFQAEQMLNEATSYLPALIFWRWELALP